MTSYKIFRKDARTGKETILGFYEEITSAQDAILDLFNEDYDMGCLTWEEAVEATADRIFGAYPSRYGEYSYSYDSDMTRIDTTDGTECKTLEELARVLNQFIEYPHDLVDDTIYMQLWDDLQGEDRDVCGYNGYVLTMADNGKYIVVER